jgi:hypothetical protein
VPVDRQHVHQHAGDLGLIVHDEDPQRRHVLGWSHHRWRRGRRRGHRQGHDERGAALGRALEAQRAAVALHDALAQGQAEAGALADGLRPEERLEDALARGGRDAGPVVDHPDLHLGPGYHPGGEGDRPGRGDGADGVMRVRHEI